MVNNARITQISSLDNPALLPYRTLRRPVDHIRAGIFVAEGEKVVRRLLASHLEVVSLLLTTEWYERLIITDHVLASREVPDIYMGGKKLLESIVGFNLHQGIMAVAKVPAEPALEMLAGSLQSPWMMVALDGLVNAENVGVVVRNAAAFGASAIIAGPTSGSPYLRRAVRNSMGAVFTMPVFHPKELPPVLNELHRQWGADIIGTDLQGTPVQDVPVMKKNVCIVLGNEGEGISKPVLEACTYRVAIPMMNGTDSLNVASASAVFCYEMRRRMQGG